MGATNRRVRHYECEVVVSSGADGPGPVAFVYLFDEQRQLLASIACHSDPARIRPAEQQENGVILASLAREELPTLIDLLRNEKPVFLRWEEATSTLRVTSGEEPVGEEELKRMFSWLYV
jgi:hypothetical protein